MTARKVLEVTRTFTHNGRVYKRGMWIDTDYGSALARSFQPQTMCAGNFRTVSAAEHAELTRAVRRLAKESAQQLNNGRSSEPTSRMRSTDVPAPAPAATPSHSESRLISVRTAIRPEVITFDHGASRGFQALKWTRDQEKVCALYGCIDDGKQITINGVLGITEWSEYGRAVMDLDLMWDRARPGSVPIGTLHSHPGTGRVSPSQTDLRSWTLSADEYETPWVGMIVAPNPDISMVTEWSTPVMGIYVARPRGSQETLVHNAQVKFDYDWTRD